MNATTASFLGLRRRQRAQDLLREAPGKAPRKAPGKAPRKAPGKALRRAPASRCARASQKCAIRIAAIASVQVNCTAQSRVTFIHCIAHQLLVNLVAGAVLAMFAPPGQRGVGPSVRICHRTQHPSLGGWPECQNGPPQFRLFTLSWQDKRTKIRPELTFPLTHTMPL
jgi:hypothetical protein